MRTCPNEVAVRQVPTTLLDLSFVFCDGLVCSNVIKKGQVIAGKELIIEKEAVLDSIYLVMAGKLSLENDKLNEERLTSGQLFGGLSYLNDVPFDQQVKEYDELSLIAWNKDVLKKYLQDAPHIEAIFQRLFGDEIARRKQVL